MYNMLQPLDIWPPRLGHGHGEPVVMARVQLVQGGATPLTGGGADQGQQETGDNSQKHHHVQSALALLYAANFMEIRQ